MRKNQKNDQSLRGIKEYQELLQAEEFFFGNGNKSELDTRPYWEYLYPIKGFTNDIKETLIARGSLADGALSEDVEARLKRLRIAILFKTGQNELTKLKNIVEKDLPKAQADDPRWFDIRFSASEIDSLAGSAAANFMRADAEYAENMGVHAFTAFIEDTEKTRKATQLVIAKDILDLFEKINFSDPRSASLIPEHHFNYVRLGFAHKFSDSLRYRFVRAGFQLSENGSLACKDFETRINRVQKNINRFALRPR